MNITALNRKSLLLDGIFFLAGSILYALSVDIFTAPNDIAPGGLTGIGTLLNFLFGMPIGTAVLILNIPLFIWGAIEFGWKFLGKTVVSTVLYRPIRAIKCLQAFLAVFFPAQGWRLFLYEAVQQAAQTLLQGF